MIVKPAGHPVTVEEFQKSGEISLDWFIYRCRPEADRSEGNQVACQSCSPEQ